MQASMIPGCAFFALALACADDAPGTAGPPVEIYDSAGIRVVHSHEPAHSADDFWRIADEPRLRIEGSDGMIETLPTDPASAFRTTDGHIVVGDGLSTGLDRVLVFDSGGSHLATYGREGQGPCEFNQVFWAAPYRGDSIAVHDFVGVEISIFSADGECGRTVQLERALPRPRGRLLTYSPGIDGVFADGSYLAFAWGVVEDEEEPGIRWFRHDLWRVHPDARSWDTIGTFRLTPAWIDGNGVRSIPFVSFASRVTSGNSFFHTEGTDPEIERYGPEGDLDLILRWDGAKAPVTPELMEEYRSRYRERQLEFGTRDAQEIERIVEQLPFPDSLPVVTDLVVDSAGNLWAKRYGSPAMAMFQVDGTLVPWEVFDPEGRWLGRVAIVDRFRPTQIGTDFVLGIYRDELDVRHVEVYELIR